MNQNIKTTVARKRIYIAGPMRGKVVELYSQKKEEPVMASDTETVAEIVSEMRRIKLCIPRGKVRVDDFDCLVKVSMSDLANRVESANKREVAELREYLKEAIGEKCGHCKAEWYGKCLTEDGGDCKLIAKWRKALEGANHT